MHIPQSFDVFVLNSDQIFSKHMTIRLILKYVGLVWFTVFNATFNNISVISWPSVLLVEETGVSGETTDLSQEIIPDCPTF